MFAVFTIGAVRHRRGRHAMAPSQSKSWAHVGTAAIPSGSRTSGHPRFTDRNSDTNIEPRISTQDDASPVLW